MDSSKIKAIIFAILALFVALYLGITAATAQFETIAWVLGGLTLTSCLILGRRIWLLIPFLGAINMTLSVPGQPDTLMIAQLLVIGFSMLLTLTRKLPFQLVVTELEGWMFLIALLIIQVYVRNPTGFSIFGGASVGGKPYVIFTITTVATFLLCGMRVPEADIRKALRLSILGGLVNSGISVLGLFIPSVGLLSGTNIASANGPEFSNKAVDAGQATRVGFFMTAGTNLSLWISSFRSPFTACFHPVWAPLIILSFALAAFSGFRSAISLVGITYLIGICYRGGFIQVFISCMLGILGLALLAFINLASPLPPNIQRTLSFLPGTWEQRYHTDAEGSTEWRVEMWQEALGSDRWIHNKLLGDGLGFTAQQLLFQRLLADGQGARTGLSGFDLDREAVLASGAYHSVFVSSVRTVGYVGFVIYFIAIIRVAVHAHRLIRKYRPTPHYSTCLFFGIPAIISPIWLPFSASTFIYAASATFGSIAMLRILQNNLPPITAPLPEEIPARGKLEGSRVKSRPGLA